MYVCVLLHIISTHAFTHITLAADVWSCVSAGNPLWLKTGAVLLAYTNARLLIQVITFLQRPGLHMHTHPRTEWRSKASSLLLFLARPLTQHTKRSIFVLTLCCYTRMCRHSKWRVIEKHNPSGWFMTYVQKRTGFPLFTSAHIPFFSLLRPHTHTYRERHQTLGLLAWVH